MVESQGSWARWPVQTPALPLTTCVALREGIPAQKPQFPNLEDGAGFELSISTGRELGACQVFTRQELMWLLSPAHASDSPPATPTFSEAKASLSLWEAQSHPLEALELIFLERSESHQHLYHVRAQRGPQLPVPHLSSTESLS